jgi:hypothetical protein
MVPVGTVNVYELYSSNQTWLIIGNFLQDCSKGVSHAKAITEENSFSFWILPQQLCLMAHHENPKFRS